VLAKDPIMLRLAIVSVVALALPRVAAAQPAGNLTLDTFRPAVDSRGYLTVNASQTLAAGELSFGLGALDWGHHLLALDAAGAPYAIDDMITATLIGARGFRLGGLALEAGASLPLRIMNGVQGSTKIDGQGTGNLGVYVKARVVDGIGVLARVYAPTVAPTERFLGEDQWVPELSAIVDHDFGRLRLAANGGLRVRARTTFAAGDRAITFGSELPFGVGAAYAVAPQRFDVVGELTGARPLGAHQHYQPLEALAGVKVYLARSSYLTLGAGRGLLTGQGGNPDVRAFIGIVFEPGRGERGGGAVAIAEVDEPPPDRDGDRIPDELDHCPDQPEDRDGFEDQDGCPDPDNDNDRIPDKDDQCPDEPETYNGFQDDDGCPDHNGVTERNVEGDIVTMRPINFEYDQAVIKRDSDDILDAVVATMNGNPEIERIEVQGHTDERGDDAYNLDLSQRRADAVVAYLVAHGVAAARLTARGYGETQPVDHHHNEAAWTKNRRVEFVLKKR
jgi:OOP family OmpA-OmpF porin